jgi:hypothetical protein
MTTVRVSSLAAGQGPMVIVVVVVELVPERDVVERGLVLASPP